MKLDSRSCGPALLASVLGLALAGCAQLDKRTALDRYVAEPDANFRFSLASTNSAGRCAVYVLDLTSQAWLTTNEVDRPLWKHWLTIIKPEKVDHRQALLFIGGGGNDKPAPKNVDDNLVRIAQETHSVVAELKMVPNQPVQFRGENRTRVEDELIAYTWDKYLRTGDEKWPARLPMTKSAVRAMDTITTFCGGPSFGNVKVDQFVVAGGSKRGWTTWTTAAVDKRVVGMVPIVIDVLNLESSMRHHYGAYGFWAPAVGNYTELNIMDWTGTPQFQKLMQIEDPYSYRQRFRMPKLMINASGDQFFLPDSSQFYFQDLPGIKYLRYVPNADHSLKGTDAWQSLLAFYEGILNQAALPQFNWTWEKNDAIRIKTSAKPSAITLWQATNPNARDFRLETLGPVWQSKPLALGTDGSVLAQVPAPAKGWTAFFVELTFPGIGSVPYKFTTPVRVTPDTEPFQFKPDHGVMNRN